MKTTIKRRMRQEVAQGNPLVRAELTKRGFRGNTLSEMAARGDLYRVAHGVYASTSGSASELFDYELAAKVVPAGVFTLFSALRIHGLTDENPRQMTMAIPAKSHAPKSTLPVEFIYMKPEILAKDVEVKSPHGSEFRVFSVERTIVECFKARNKIGVDVAVRALRDAVSKGKVDFAGLGRVMSDCRMSRVMAPYVEGLA
ncbi:MAG: type IV toxin-antitoxin system AbiEi family antitoxin domain-containing protein [Kiritimatiellae bacterium]|nr:type IV toxin-antitoxin system AbiEi family antitoxin domain-containing protein [Kiritimatiellia bacterium]